MAPTLPRSLVAVAAVALLVAACGGDDAPSGPAASDLNGRAFTSTSVSGAELVTGTHLSLSFDDGVVAAFAGCNTFTGGFELDGDRLVVAEALSATLMACDDPLTAQDAWVVALLGARPAVALTGDDLTLTGASITATLRSSPAGASRLDGTTWRVERLETDGTSLAVPDAAVVSFTDATVNVTTGCNRAFGPITIADGAITVGPLGQTSMACAGDVATFEDALLALLDGELSYDRDGMVATVSRGADSLTLRKIPNP